MFDAAYDRPGHHKRGVVELRFGEARERGIFVHFGLSLEVRMLPDGTVALAEWPLLLAALGALLLGALLAWWQGR